MKIENTIKCILILTFRIVEMKYLKKRIKLIDENLNILYDVGSVQGLDPDAKILFKSTKDIFDQLQKRYSDVSIRSKEVFIKKSSEDNFEEDEKDSEEFYQQIEKERELY